MASRRVIAGMDVSDIFDGYVDLDQGVIDVRLGSPHGGIRDEPRERRLLAALLLGNLADDEGAVRAMANTLDNAIGERLDALAAHENDMELPRQLLAALDRYLSGEREAE